MADVTFSSGMQGLRLEDFFTPIVSTVEPGSMNGMSKVTFQVITHKLPVEILYGGPVVTESGGGVSYLRFGPEESPWLVYGEPNGPVLFTYVDLARFHEQGVLAAAVIMAGDDRLIGSSQGDFLEGYAGNDWLDGGGGEDTLHGGLGYDTYIVNNKDDRVFEAIGGGYDIVLASVSFAMAADAEIEELRAAASAFSLALTGNNFANLIVGTSGNDELDGKGGVDTLIGGAGDDLYMVDNAWDLVLENDGEGYDTVIASASYGLGAHVEVLKAVDGYASINLTGNALSNEIVGNLGANDIYGLDGNDQLYGDGGNDRIYGGNGQDALYGGMGNDTLDGVASRGVV